MTTKTQLQDLQRSIAATRALLGQADLRRAVEAYEASSAAVAADHTVVRVTGRTAGIGFFALGSPFARSA